MIDVLQAAGVLKGIKIQGDPLNDSLCNSVLNQAYMFPDLSKRSKNSNLKMKIPKKNSKIESTVGTPHQIKDKFNSNVV